MKITDDIRKERIIVVDVDPPQDPANMKYLTKALEEYLAGFSGYLDVTCNSGGVTRYNPIETAHEFQEHGFNTIFNLNCRDFTPEQLQEEASRARIYGLHNAMAVYGDRIEGVPYKIKSTDLIGMLSACFCTGATVNPVSADLGRQLDLAKQRQDAGAQFLLTQPLFYHQGELLSNFFEQSYRTGIKIPLFVGVLIPHRSSANISLDGFSYPEEIRRRLEGSNGYEGRKVAVETIRQFASGGLENFYIIPEKVGKQRDKYRSVAEVISSI